MGTIKFEAGMDVNAVRAKAEQGTYRNEKVKEKAVEDAILSFNKADKDGNGILSTEEVESYEKCQKWKKRGAAFAGFLTGIAIALLLRKKKPGPIHREVIREVERELNEEDIVRLVNKGVLNKKEAIKLLNKTKDIEIYM